MKKRKVVYVSYLQCAECGSKRIVTVQGAPTRIVCQRCGSTLINSRPQ